MRFIVSLVATLTSLTALVVGTLLFATLTLLTVWIPPRGSSITWCARTWARLWLAASWIRVESERPPDLVPQGDYVFLANHASWFDIPALLVTLPGRVRFAAKRGLFQVPIFGWALKAGGFIPVDRGDKKRAREALAAAQEGLASGGSMLFFPEGTRSSDGRISPFQRGGFLLALKAERPVVPVGIEGSFGVMPKGPFWVRPGLIRLRYGSPRDPSGYGLRGLKDLVDDVRREVGELAGAELR
ncbi:MAG: 1-acyl-sn-glycerol-3-phosphate acyltransferase [Acidobacteria bacterium]|nr:1-acyl-sn-glycerol-3-phosphate acyltransferase [Acidobacteriota bacterium]